MYPMGVPLNLFSRISKMILKLKLSERKKWLLVLFIMLGSLNAAQAVVIYGIHLSSCERELGVILHVEPLELTFLTLNGKTKKN